MMANINRASLPTPTELNWVTAFGNTINGVTFDPNLHLSVTWTDLSDGLPFPWSPANKVMYEEGTTDRIYLATDHGVFMRQKNANNTWTNWEQFMCSSSPVIDMEINYCTRKIIMATYGRGIWEADLPESHSIRRPLNPFANGTMPNWIAPTNVNAADFYVQVHGDVVVHNGETLEVKAKVRMDPHKRIMVEAGGKLNINEGSIIGCDCPEGMMYGIVAEGPDGSTAAAEVTINNATIHDARLAVTNIYTDVKADYDEAIRTLFIVIKARFIFESLFELIKIHCLSCDWRHI